MSTSRDPVWYREEAERQRQKAADISEIALLRDSYLALREYERLAVILDESILAYASRRPTNDAAGSADDC